MSDGRRKRRMAVACLAVLAASAAGCVLFEGLGRGPRRFAFSHALHLAEPGLQCINCHADAARGEEPGMPAPDTCAACHDELDAERPPDRQTATFFDGEVFRAAHAVAQDAEIVFSHARHAEYLECSACHADVERNDDVLELEPASMEDCTRCHAGTEARAKGVEDDCATCHTAVNAAWAPPDHAQDWTKQHGLTVRACTGETVNRCELCHTEATCLGCHKEEAPTNHTLYFRERGHALFSSLDRQNCAACHEPDACERCHREVEPRSHTASFTGSFATHCLGCHFPLQGEGCVTCHKATPGHMATPKPPDHTPVMICRQCHGVVATLPHADKGDDCNACHP